MEYDEMTDELLLEAAAHDSEAFTHLYRRHTTKVTSFALKRCATSSEVADLVGAVWLEIVKSRGSFDPSRGRVVPWILGIAANLAASDARRRMREDEVLQRFGGQRRLEPNELEQLEEALVAASVMRRLSKQLAGLSDAERSVAELVLLDGLSPSEAAKALGITSATARMRLARAKKKLRPGDHSFRPAPLEVIDPLEQEVSP